MRAAVNAYVCVWVASSVQYTGRCARTAAAAAAGGPVVQYKLPSLCVRRCSLCVCLGSYDPSRDQPPS